MKRSTLSDSALRRVVKGARARAQLTNKAIAEREKVSIDTVKGVIKRHTTLKGS